ncbi:MAG: alpha-amylase [Elusimicrobia bacterium]|nr:alpha-amylase [Elusimicrobiota bacterium]
MRRHPHLYELNAAVWLNRLSLAQGKRTTLSAVPEKELRALAERGIDVLWLMGVWRRSPRSRAIALAVPELRRTFEAALPGWVEADVLGSPYSVYEYVLDPSLGEPEELLEFKKRLNAHGLRLVVDFVSNHLAVDHPWTERFPDRFVLASKGDAERHPGWFFSNGRGDQLAHGRDPNFPPWNDTSQVNFFSPALQEAYEDEMLRITQVADGVRCDMAMLALNRVFRQVWGRFVKDPTPNEEFWSLLLHRAKARRPDFLFLAESYWDLEWELQQAGFDYTYDKVLYDRLRHSSAEDVRGHLRADLEFQSRSARFIENHDEPRAIEAFGRERAIAAAAVAATVPGMRFFHDGQLDGKRMRIPVQLAREPIESPDRATRDFYERLLSFCAAPSMHDGTWRPIAAIPAWEGNAAHRNILAWQWRLAAETKLVIVNLSPVTAQARLRLDLGLAGELELRDALTDIAYPRSAEDVRGGGLYVELGPWKAHLFDVSR